MPTILLPCTFPTDNKSPIYTTSQQHEQQQQQLPALQLVAGPRLRIGGQLLQVLVVNSAAESNPAATSVSGAAPQPMAHRPVVQRQVLQALQSAAQALPRGHAVQDASQCGAAQLAEDRHVAFRARKSNLIAAAAAATGGAGKQPSGVAILSSATESPHSTGTPKIADFAQQLSVKPIACGDLESFDLSPVSALPAAAIGGGAGAGSCAAYELMGRSDSEVAAAAQSQVLQLQQDNFAHRQTVVLQTMERTGEQQQQRPQQRTQQQWSELATSSRSGIATAFAGFQQSLLHQQLQAQHVAPQYYEQPSSSQMWNPASSASCQAQPGMVTQPPSLQLEPKQQQQQAPYHLLLQGSQPVMVALPAGSYVATAAAAAKQAQRSMRSSDLQGPEGCSVAPQQLEQQISGAYASGFTDGAEAFKRQGHQPSRVIRGMSNKRRRVSPVQHKDSQANASIMLTQCPSIVDVLTAGAASAASASLDNSSAAMQLQQMSDEKLVCLAAAVVSRPVDKLCGVEHLDASSTDISRPVDKLCGVEHLDASSTDSRPDTPTAEPPLLATDSPPAVAAAVSSAAAPSAVKPCAAWQQLQQQQWHLSPSVVSLFDDDHSEQGMLELAQWLEL